MSAEQRLLSGAKTQRLACRPPAEAGETHGQTLLQKPQEHLDFGLTASRMVRGYISIVVSHPACAYLSDSSEKQIQGLWGRKEAEDRSLGSERWPGEGPGSAATRLEPWGAWSHCLSLPQHPWKTRGYVFRGGSEQAQ